MHASYASDSCGHARLRDKIARLSTARPLGGRGGRGVLIRVAHIWGAASWPLGAKWRCPHAGCVVYIELSGL